MQGDDEVGLGGGLEDEHAPAADSREERQREIRRVLLKALGIVVAIAVVIWLGSWVMIKGLGLDDIETTGPPVKLQPVTPLPTTALPVPSESPDATDDPEDETTEEPTADPSPSGDLQLSVSPVAVGPMERINLTGQWPGHDAVGLAVQRFEGGQWIDFGVQARVKVGAFTTYIMTGRTGEQRFRMFDPGSKTASNEVTVTIG